MKVVALAALLCACAFATEHPKDVYDTKGWGDHLPDIGVKDFSCPAATMLPSKTVPTSAHSVRPADIKIVMALGDSLTAANGAGAEDPVMIILQYRGLAFQAGADKSLEEHITIPNILRKFNPSVFGGSKGIGSVNVWEVAYLNAGIPGAVAADLPGQARDLVAKLNAHPDQINLKNDWKLLNIFIGGNDVCGFCRHQHTNTPANFVQNIQEAIQIIYDNVPRVIVSLTTMLHLEMVRQIDNGEFFCKALHVEECGCESNYNFTDAQMSKLCTEYQQHELQLQNSGVFDKRDDFTLVVQPFFNDVTTPPMKNGRPDLSFFCPDCFHFSQQGHSIVSTWLWKNIMEPVGHKTTKADLSKPSLPLACPDTACPFVRTTKNSANCASYVTEAAEEPLF